MMGLSGNHGGHWKALFDKLHALAINPVVDAEMSLSFSTLEHLHEAVTSTALELREIPSPALFLAAKACALHRRRGGSKGQVLPDFFIEAHAAVKGGPQLRNGLVGAVAMREATLGETEAEQYSTLFNGTQPSPWLEALHRNQSTQPWLPSERCPTVSRVQASTLRGRGYSLGCGALTMTVCMARFIRLRTQARRCANCACLQARLPQPEDDLGDDGAHAGQTRGRNDAVALECHAARPSFSMCPDAAAELLI